MLRVKFPNQDRDILVWWQLEEKMTDKSGTVYKPKQTQNAKIQMTSV